MKQEKISVVVPIYKVEKYLSKCIESICKQTYTNLEVILVDDGSPDKCGDICDKWAKKDDRIKVIHKKNEGVSAARNTGIDMATGKYIAFVDSDDFLELDAIEYLYKLLINNKAQLSMSEIRNIYDDKRELQKIEDLKDEKINTYTSEQALENMLYNKGIINAPYAKLYETKLFENIRYPVGMLYEDFGTTYKVMDKADTIVTTSKRTYNYLANRKGSTMNSNFSDIRLQGLQFAEEILIFMKENYPNLESAAIARLYMECIFIFVEMPFKKKFKKENERVKFYLRKYRWKILKDSKMPIQHRFLCFSAIFSRYSLRICWKIKERIKMIRSKE